MDNTNDLGGLSMGNKQVVPVRIPWVYVRAMYEVDVPVELQRNEGSHDTAESRAEREAVSLATDADVLPIERFI